MTEKPCPKQRERHLLSTAESAEKSKIEYATGVRQFQEQEQHPLAARCTS